MAPSLMHLEKLCKVYFGDGPPTHALTDINLSIRRGEYVVLNGPSGSGKSTLLSILGLLDELTDGSYRFDGREVGKMSFAEKAKIRNAEIGFIFQNFNLIGELSVRDNVALPLTFRSAFSSRERARRVSFALQRVDMEAFADKRPWELSGGQQQRVAVARAIAGSPAILLADEPTGNLDTENGQMIMSLLAGLNREGNTVCLITHEAQWIESGRRVLQLSNGRLRSSEHEDE